MSVSHRALRAPTTDGPPAAGQAPRSVVVMAALSRIFSLFCLNAALLVACLPVATVPVAFQSAMVAYDRWREDGEERMLSEFVAALRASAKWRTTVTLGVPLVAAALALSEVIFSARAGGYAGAICAGLGVASLALTLTGFGYLTVLGARYPARSSSDAWHAAIILVVTNIPRASAVLMAAFVVCGLLMVRDPALCVIGLPLGLLALVRRAATRGIRDTRARVPGAAELFDNWRSEGE